jgi:hypothetical protein
MAKVKLLIHVEFAAHSEAQAREVVRRIRGDLIHSIQHGPPELEGVTGVVPGSVKVDIKLESA